MTPSDQFNIFYFKLSCSHRECSHITVAYFLQSPWPYSHREQVGRKGGSYRRVSPSTGSPNKGGDGFNFPIIPINIVWACGRYWAQRNTFTVSPRRSTLAVSIATCRPFTSQCNSLLVITWLVYKEECPLVATKLWLWHCFAHAV